MNVDGKHDELAERLLHAGPMRTNVSKASQLAPLLSRQTTFAADLHVRDWDSKDCVARPLQFVFGQGPDGAGQTEKGL